MNIIKYICSFHESIRNKTQIYACISSKTPLFLSDAILLMQSYPARVLGRRLQVDWARDPREGPRGLMSLMVYFEPVG